MLGRHRGPLGSVVWQPRASLTDNKPESPSRSVISLKSHGWHAAGYAALNVPAKIDGHPAAVSGGPVGQVLMNPPPRWYSPRRRPTLPPFRAGPRSLPQARRGAVSHSLRAGAKLHHPQKQVSSMLCSTVHPLALLGGGCRAVRANQQPAEWPPGRGWAPWPAPAGRHGFQPLSRWLVPPPVKLQPVTARL